MDLAPGQTFDAVVLLSFTAPNPLGARFGLTFNPAYLDVVGVDLADFRFGGGSAGSQHLAWSVDHANGIVSVGGVLFLDPQSAYSVVVQPLATIHLKARAIGQGKLRITNAAILTGKGSQDEAALTARTSVLQFRVGGGRATSGPCGTAFGPRMDGVPAPMSPNIQRGLPTLQFMYGGVNVKAGEEAGIPIILDSDQPVRDITFAVIQDRLPDGSGGLVNLERVEIDACVSDAAADGRMHVEQQPWSVSPSGASTGSFHLIGGNGVDGLEGPVQVATVVVRGQKNGRTALHLTATQPSADGSMWINVSDGVPGSPLAPLSQPVAPKPLQPAATSQVVQRTPRPTAIRPPTPLPLSPSVARALFEPQQVELRVGQVSSLDLVLETSVETRATEFALSFDPKVLALEDVQPGSFFSDWADHHRAEYIVIPGFTIDQAKGEVGITGIALLGGDDRIGGPSGHGSLAHLRVHGIAPGRTRIALTHMKVVVGDLVDVTRLDAEVTIVG